MDDPCTFLQWAVSGGLSVVVGALESVLVEYWPAYGDLAPKWKRLVFLGLCLAPAALFTGLSYLPGLGCAPIGWWGALLAAWNVFLAFGAGTMAHTRKL